MVRVALVSKFSRLMKSVEPVNLPSKQNLGILVTNNMVFSTHVKTHLISERLTIETLDKGRKLAHTAAKMGTTFNQRINATRPFSAAVIGEKTIMEHVTGDRNVEVHPEMTISNSGIVGLRDQRKLPLLNHQQRL